ncbi:MAG: type I methionyl aminopeptidase [Alphaproteobacteria bacterium]|nr:type I methionyl aminopeptidase [Alphaproteobacteria bacterium]
MNLQKDIKIYSPKEIDGIRKAGHLARDVLNYIAPFVKEGVSTLELNDLCDSYTRKHGATSAPLEVSGYKHAICTTLNDEICHGVPHAKRMLEDGDILNIDITVNLNGFYGDTSRMFKIGNISNQAEKLIRSTYKAMMEAIKIVAPGQPFSLIGKTIEKIVAPYNYGIIRDFCGHGIGTMFHGSPHIFHFYHKAYDKVIMQEGMIFTIEPMINASPNFDYFINKKDGWTVATADGALSAQFEHTVLVTKNGHEILT